jgi:hypothetical protein
VIPVLLALWGCGGGGGGGGSQPPPSSVQRPPTISGTALSGVEDSNLSGRLTLSDPEGGALQVQVTANPQFGTLLGPDSTGAFSYTPRPNFFGVDTFAISVTDLQGLSASATVVLTIAGVNDTPMATGESVMVAPALPTTIDVLANDSDIEGQQLRPEITTQSVYGDAEVQPNGTVVFTPALGFAGETGFQYRVVDPEGSASEPVALAIDVRPVKSVVYVTATIAHRQVVLKRPTSMRDLGSSQDSDLDIHNLRVSANGNTALWQVSEVGSPINTGYRYNDVADAGAAEHMLGAYNLNSGLELSPTGTHVLLPERVNIGAVESLAVHLRALYSDATRSIHSDPATGFVSSYKFSPHGDFVVYRANSPGLPQNDVRFYRTDVAGPAMSTLLTVPSVPTATLGEDLNITPDGTRVVFSGSLNDLSGPTPLLFSTSTDGSTNARVLSPSQPQAFFSIPDIEIAPTSRHVAFTYRSLYFPPGSVRPLPSFVVDLETGAYVQIGGSLNSDRVTQPVFNRDGTRVALGLSTATESAVYEASVQNPTVLTRVGAAHEGRVKIGNLRYAEGDRVVYTADVRETEVYEIFVAKDGQEQRLNADLGTSVILSLQDVGFVLSADGTTVAYAQRVTPTGPQNLFLVDVTTPGSPLQVAENSRVGASEEPTYAIVE